MFCRVTAALWLLWATFTFAQGPAAEWLRLAGGNNYDEGFASCTDSDGNLIVGGRIPVNATFGATNLSSAQGGFLAKYSGTGEVVWVRSMPSIPSSIAIWPRSLKTDPQGNIYVSGELQAEVVITNTTFTNYFYRLFLCKYDSAGTLLWTMARTNRFVDLNGEGGMVAVAGSALDATGNLFVAGSFSGSFFIGSTNLHDNGNGWTDFFFAKFSSTGGLLWVVDGGTNAFDDASGITLAREGRVYVAAVAGGDCSLGPLAIPKTNFVAELDPNGVVLAVQHLDFSPIGGLVSNGSGEFYAWGRKGNPERAVLAKFASLSNVIWRTEISNTWGAFPRAQGAALDRYGNIWAGINYYDQNSNVLTRVNSRGVIDCEIPLNFLARDLKLAPDVRGHVLGVGSSGVQVTRLGGLSATNGHWTYGESEIVVTKVNVPPPALSISRSGPEVTLQWPAWANHMEVEASSEANGNWQALTNSPIQAPGHNAVTLPREPGRQFYRLKLR